MITYVLVTPTIGFQSVLMPGNMYSIRSTQMLANFTDRRSSFPWGKLHDLPVTDRDRNTQLLHGGAKTRTPPGRVFHTWASKLGYTGI